MKCYTLVTGTIFGLITVMHLWRMVFENHRLAAEPFFLLLTVLSAGLCVWGLRLTRTR